MQVPVYAVGVGGDAYQGFNLHLRWDPAVFSFSSASAAGGVFDPTASPSTGFCVSPNTSVYDSDGGGVVLGCAGYSATDASGKLLATFTLTPAASGCSKIHLYTLGSPDGGDSSSGTFTVNAEDDTAQANAYYDGAANTLGQSCVPPALPTTSTAPRTRLAPAPAAASPSGGNCTYDNNADGFINILDLAGVAGHYGQSVGSPGWDPKYDVNADDRINILDLSITASEYNWTTVGCAPEYPYYNPGPSWDGQSISQNGFDWSQYLIFTGAMVYTAGSYPCGFTTLSGWAFISPTTSTYLSACELVGNLATLADNIGLWDYAHGLPAANQVFVGPNDCMAFFGGQSIATAASVLYGVLQIATTYAQGHDPGIEFTAVVDNEGYTPPLCDAPSAREFQCQTNDVTFFRDYPGPIGPAGAPPCTANDQEALSVAGGGPAIPQVYTWFNALAINPATATGCTIDGHGPGAGAWPYTIASGYAGVQSYPLPHGFYTSWQANIRWSLCHGTPPATDFDWSFPGGRG